MGGLETALKKQKKNSVRVTSPPHHEARLDVFKVRHVELHAEVCGMGGCGFGKVVACQCTE